MAKITINKLLVKATILGEYLSKKDKDTYNGLLAKISKKLNESPKTVKVKSEDDNVDGDANATA